MVRELIKPLWEKMENLGWEEILLYENYGKSGKIDKNRESTSYCFYYKKDLLFPYTCSLGIIASADKIAIRLGKIRIDTLCKEYSRGEFDLSDSRCIEKALEAIEEGLEAVKEDMCIYAAELADSEE